MSAYSGRDQAVSSHPFKGIGAAGDFQLSAQAQVPGFSEDLYYLGDTPPTRITNLPADTIGLQVEVRQDSIHLTGGLALLDLRPELGLVAACMMSWVGRDASQTAIKDRVASLYKYGADAGAFPQGSEFAAVYEIYLRFVERAPMRIKTLLFGPSSILTRILDFGVERQLLRKRIQEGIFTDGHWVPEHVRYSLRDDGGAELFSRNLHHPKDGLGRFLWDFGGLPAEAVKLIRSAARGIEPNIYGLLGAMGPSADDKLRYYALVWCGTEADDATCRYCMSFGRPSTGDFPKLYYLDTARNLCTLEAKRPSPLATMGDVYKSQFEEVYPFGTAASAATLIVKCVRLWGLLADGNSFEAVCHLLDDMDQLGALRLALAGLHLTQMEAGVVNKSWNLQSLMAATRSLPRVAMPNRREMDRIVLGLLSSGMPFACLATYRKPVRRHLLYHISLAHADDSPQIATIRQNTGRQVGAFGEDVFLQLAVTAEDWGVRGPVADGILESWEAKLAWVVQLQLAFGPDTFMGRVRVASTDPHPAFQGPLSFYFQAGSYF